jgi:hypothetical protein
VKAEAFYRYVMSLRQCTEQAADAVRSKLFGGVGDVPESASSQSATGVGATPAVNVGGGGSSSTAGNGYRHRSSSGNSSTCSCNSSSGNSGGHSDNGGAIAGANGSVEEPIEGQSCSLCELERLEPFNVALACIAYVSLATPAPSVGVVAGCPGLICFMAGCCRRCTAVECTVPQP